MHPGMRIRVKDVLDMLAAGVPEAEILANFPYLQAADSRACLEYAAQEADPSVLLEARDKSLWCGPPGLPGLWCGPPGLPDSHTPFGL